MSTLLAIHWNASPELFSLGPISIRWYGLMFALGFLFGFSILTKMFKYEGSNPEWVEKLFVYVIIATIVGARLGHVFFYGWEYYSQHLMEIILPIAKVGDGYKFVGFQGLASHGGAFGILLAVIIFSKRVTKGPVLWTLDRLLVPVALVGAMIRTGNLMNSEIYGVATSLPWGFIFDRNNETIAKHPTMIYEALCYLITFGLMMYFYYKKNGMKDRTGFLTGVFFIGIFFSRFMIEFVKENQEAFENGMALNMGQILSIPFIIAAIWLLYHSLTHPPVVYTNQIKK
ncbi:MAG: prolipoprotein diacylglyceryl transferase [Mariniphaga sp.]|nr:prolipoprotein diacylglyceryl transferase [Mariniphaga sp.]